MDEIGFSLIDEALRNDVTLSDGGKGCYTTRLAYETRFAGQSIRHLIILVMKVMAAETEHARQNSSKQRSLHAHDFSE